MSEFSPALAKTLRNEGGFFHDSISGEVVNQGITCWTLRSLGLMPGVPSNTPRDVPASEGEVSVIRSLTPFVIESIYKTQYWDTIHAGEIRFQELADKVFDVHVNTGRGALLLQRAFNRMNYPGGPVLVEDGIVGRKTLDAVNGVDGRILLGCCSDEQSTGSGFRLEAEKYYRSLNSQNLESWLTRLRRP